MREYWLIDPERKQAEFHRLGEDGLDHVVLPEGVYGSEVLKGLRLEVAWRWQEPLPSLLELLKTWGLV